MADLPLREEIRKTCGEGAVNTYDTMKGLEDAMQTLLQSIITKCMTEAKEDRTAQCATLACLCEALSEAYAGVATRYAHTSIVKMDKGATISMAVQSLLGNLHEEWENHEAKASNVKDLIKAAAKKVAGE